MKLSIATLLLSMMAFSGPKKRLEFQFSVEKPIQHHCTSILDSVSDNFQAFTKKHGYEDMIKINLSGGHYGSGILGYRATDCHAIVSVSKEFQGVLGLEYQSTKKREMLTLQDASDCLSDLVEFTQAEQVFPMELSVYKKGLFKKKEYCKTYGFKVITK